MAMPPMRSSNMNGYPNSGMMNDRHNPHHGSRYNSKPHRNNYAHSGRHNYGTNHSRNHRGSGSLHSTRGGPSRGPQHNSSQSNRDRNHSYHQNISYSQHRSSHSNHNTSSGGGGGRGYHSQHNGHNGHNPRFQRDRNQNQNRSPHSRDRHNNPRNRGHNPNHRGSPNHGHLRSSNANPHRLNAQQSISANRSRRIRSQHNPHSQHNQHSLNSSNPNSNRIAMNQSTKPLVPAHNLNTASNPNHHSSHSSHPFPKSSRTAHSDSNSPSKGPLHRSSTKQSILSSAPIAVDHHQIHHHSDHITPSEHSNHSSNPLSGHSHHPLDGPMQQLPFQCAPYKYDYRSKLNMALFAAKHGQKRSEWDMDPTTITPWSYTTEIEKKTKVREYLLPCLKLTQQLMAMDEAIDFILPPNDKETNPEFWKQFQRFDTDSKSRNMCLEWICNLLKSDYYETVDDFAVDIRNIWENVYAVFGRNTHDEWSKNAQCIQFAFEKKMISIPRTIPNAEQIFSANGNPTLHPLQQQHLNTESVQKEIADSLKLLKIQKVEKEMFAQAMAAQMEVDSNGNPKEVELTEKQKRQLYLNNIDTKDIYRPNRKLARPRKQTLIKPNPGNNTNGINLENTTNHKKRKRHDEGSSLLSKYGIGGTVEEGEIRYLPLDDGKMVECESWFEFVRRYNARDTIRSVMMLQEGIESVSKYDEFKKALTLKGRSVALDIKDKSAEIQNKIYDVLEMGKKRITKKDTMSLKILKDIVNRKNQENIERIMSIGGGGRKQVLDPYSNEAVRLRDAEQRAKMEKMNGRKQKKNNTSGDAMDEDSEEEEDLFDAMNSYNAIPSINKTNNKNTMKGPSSRNEDTNRHRGLEVIGKDNYAQRNNAYRPIRPGNVDDVDTNMNGNDDVWNIGSGSNVPQKMPPKVTPSKPKPVIQIAKKARRQSLSLSVEPPQIPKRETTEEKEDAKWAKYSYQNHQVHEAEEDEIDF